MLVVVKGMKDERVRWWVSDGAWRRTVCSGPLERGVPLMLLLEGPHGGERGDDALPRLVARNVHALLASALLRAERPRLPVVVGGRGSGRERSEGFDTRSAAGEGEGEHWLRVGWCDSGSL